MKHSNLRGVARGIALCCIVGISKSWAIAVVQLHSPPFPFEVAALEADARRGDVSAQRQLAELYADGWGVKADARQAANWYLKAAKQGDTLARYQVTRLYELGTGVSRSHSKAVNWYRKAKSGVDMAAGRTADTGQQLVLEYRRQGNVHMEAEWLGICAEEGNSWCRHTLARDYRDGSAALPQNFAKAMAWYLVLVDERVGEPDRELPSPEYEIGQMYAVGQGVAQSYKKAMEWYVRGANTADSSSLKAEPEFALGDLYAHGRGVDQDYRVASAWYQKAADDGFAEAQIALAQLYASGQGVPQSDRLALIGYSKVAASPAYSATLEQHQKAREQFFAVLEKGKGVPADDHEAVEWYRNRADAGDTFARRGLALSYEFGYRVAQNYSIAMAIDTALTHDPAVPEDDVVHQLIPKYPEYPRKDLAPLMNKILESGQFLIAIDEFIAHPPAPVITLTP